MSDVQTYEHDLLSEFGELLGPVDVEFDPVLEQWRLDEESILANSKIRFKEEDDE